MARGSPFSSRVDCVSANITALTVCYSRLIITYSKVNFISLSIVSMETNYMLQHGSSAFIKKQNGSKTFNEGNRLHTENKKQD